MKVLKIPISFRTETLLFFSAPMSTGASHTLGLSKSKQVVPPASATSARLTLCGTYHFCAGLWLKASHLQVVAFRSSLLAFVSRVAVAYDIRLLHKIYR